MFFYCFFFFLVFSIHTFFLYIQNPYFFFALILPIKHPLFFSERFHSILFFFVSLILPHSFFLANIILTKRKGGGGVLIYIYICFWVNLSSYYYYYYTFLFSFFFTYTIHIYVNIFILYILFLPFHIYNVSYIYKVLFYLKKKKKLSSVFLTISHALNIIIIQLLPFFPRSIYYSGDIQNVLCKKKK